MPLFFTAMITALCLDHTTSLWLAETDDDTRPKKTDGQANSSLIMLPEKVQVSAHRTCTCMGPPPKFEGEAAKLVPDFNTTKRQYGVTLVTVCVNVAGKLKASLRCNKMLVDRIIVITSQSDSRTQQICRDEGITCHATSAMHKNGDQFNKGRALGEIQNLLHTDNTLQNHAILLVDVDICLPPTLWSTMPLKMEKNTLYSAVDRCMFPSPDAYSRGYPILQGHWLTATLGMFQAYLWDSKAPIYPAGSPTAARSDYEFSCLFQHTVTLPLFLLHMGIAEDRGRDWKGYKGNEQRWENALPPPSTACPCCMYPARKKVGFPS